MSEERDEDDVELCIECGEPWVDCDCASAGNHDDDW